MELFDTTMKVLAKTLDVRQAAHWVNSSNIANIDTPGYRAQRIDFKATMENEVEKIEAAEAAGETTRTVETIGLGEDPDLDLVIEPTEDEPRSLDDNNVDLDTELGEVGKNGMMYQLAARMLQAKFDQIQTILDREGGL